MSIPTFASRALARSARFPQPGRRAVICAGLFVALIGAAPAGTAAPPRLAFTLKNQRDREYTEAYCADQVGLITVADRKGSAFIGRWSEAIGHELETTAHPPVRWVGVATLSGVPSLMRGMVKKMFGSGEKHWTLLDWNGHFEKTYALPADQANILVFAPDGRLVFQGGGREVDLAAVKSVVAAIVATAPPAPTAHRAPTSPPLPSPPSSPQTAPSG